MIRAVSHRLCLAAALLLPLAALGYSWASTYWLAQQGQEWLIPIRGYDPRDLLRGHYIRYRYDWPVAASANRQDGARAIFEDYFPSELCVEGVAPNITGVRAVDTVSRSPDQPAGHDCAIIVRAALGTRREVRGLDSGILYTSQARAIALSQQLADPKQQGLLRVRIRPDGVMRPIDLAFRPKAASGPDGGSGR
ncbi:MAG: GDYXXLXY domain-containing protein [Pseudomonadota bacterium]|uniref:GDYXXLXY domain-containing protein n=1 Tax=Sphingomonas sp. ERG5 TaxID=1381597 RepID=UPI00054C3E3F|nr:GDYXXLXY domain-containing protein [Sphingomonas sp. ERG5]